MDNAMAIDDLLADFSSAHSTDSSVDLNAEYLGNIPMPAKLVYESVRGQVYDAQVSFSSQSSGLLLLTIKLTE
jgi:hypothetical protein